MTIVTYLDGKYAIFHYIINIVGTATKVQTLTCNKTAYMQTPCNRATTYYCGYTSNSKAKFALKVSLSLSLVTPKSTCFA